MDANPYLQQPGPHCAAQQTVSQVHYAPRDDHVDEKLRAADYVLDQLDVETPAFFYDSLAEVKVSTEAGPDPEDSTLLEEKDRGPYDRESYVESHAVKALLGDFDVHSGNIQVDASGRFYPIDIDATGKMPVEYVHDNLDVDALNRYGAISRVQDAAFENRPPRMGDVTRTIEDLASDIDLEELEQQYREDDRIAYDRDRIEDDTLDHGRDRPELTQNYINDLSPAETIVRNIEFVRDKRLRSGLSRHVPLHEADDMLDQAKERLDDLADNIL
ncbi:MAG: hypothetical protein SV186_01940 [Candidatus Nanohaloarchaea archaeon]|nr:hypothetical protein [Candidatus Nanohaloarchaea archaeon]